MTLCEVFCCFRSSETTYCTRYSLFSYFQLPYQLSGMGLKPLGSPPVVDIVLDNCDSSYQLSSTEFEVLQESLGIVIYVLFMPDNSETVD